MQATEFLLSVLGSSSAPVDGRTAIQKIAYFSSIKTGVDLGYKPHFYGPYSPVVSGMLENLVAMGFIEERARLTSHDRTMYSYSLTDDGVKLLDDIRGREISNFSAIHRVVDRCERIAGNNINVLSWAAKVYFLLSQKGRVISFREAEEAGRRFGWVLSRREIGSGGRLLVGLGLVRRS